MQGQRHTASDLQLGLRRLIRLFVPIGVLALIGFLVPGAFLATRSRAMQTDPGHRQAYPAEMQRLSNANGLLRDSLSPIGNWQQWQLARLPDNRGYPAYQAVLVECNRFHAQLLDRKHTKWLDVELPTEISADLDDPASQLEQLLLGYFIDETDAIDRQVRQLLDYNCIDTPAIHRGGRRMKSREFETGAWRVLSMRVAALARMGRFDDAARSSLTYLQVIGRDRHLTRVREDVEVLRDIYVGCAELLEDLIARNLLSEATLLAVRSLPRQPDLDLTLFLEMEAANTCDATAIGLLSTPFTEMVAATLGEDVTKLDETWYDQYLQARRQSPAAEFESFLRSEIRHREELATTLQQLIEVRRLKGAPAAQLAAEQLAAEGWAQSLGTAQYVRQSYVLTWERLQAAATLRLAANKGISLSNRSSDVAALLVEFPTVRAIWASDSWAICAPWPGTESFATADEAPSNIRIVVMR